MSLESQRKILFILFGVYNASTFLQIFLGIYYIDYSHLNTFNLCLVEYVLTFKYYDNIDDDLHVGCLLTSTLISLNLTRFSLIGHNQIVLGLIGPSFSIAKSQ